MTNSSQSVSDSCHGGNDFSRFPRENERDFLRDA
jgi:hypothetical protein